MGQTVTDARQRHKLCEMFANYKREMAVNEEEFLQVRGRGGGW